MADPMGTRAQAARLLTAFEAAGAVRVDADILQPADTLLDLYGEDIRARAFVTDDPLRGEQMLRPDFTVPVVQMHMDEGAEPARYTYAGKVFRRQETGGNRASEYMQVGYELFDRVDPAAADAEVFFTIYQILAPLNLQVATGDIGVLKAAVQGLRTSQKRREALLRHIWRPARFRALLERFGGLTPPPESRVTLLADPDPMARATPLIGLRRGDEIAARIQALRQDADEPPISQEEVALLDQILGLRATSTQALRGLGQLTHAMQALQPSIDKMAARLGALEKRGVNIDDLPFEASYGRTSMEYYDGFVFGFYAAAQPDLPPVATGGRYDALTQVLGRGRSIPAVGGVIRPGLMAEVAP